MPELTENPVVAGRPTTRLTAALIDDVQIWTGVGLWPREMEALIERTPRLQAAELHADTPTRELILDALCRELLDQPWPTAATEQGRHDLTARLRTAAAHAGYTVRETPRSPQRRLETALELLSRHGQQIGEGHHQTWLLDQVVRALTGEGYRAWVGQYRQDEDGNEDAYEWSEGIAP